MDAECSVCFESYTQDGDRVPKLLPCSHTLCLQCLQQLPRHQGNRITCPECRKVHQVGQAGAEAFLTNRYILDFIEQLQEETRRVREETLAEGHPTESGDRCH